MENQIRINLSKRMSPRTTYKTFAKLLFVLEHFDKYLLSRLGLKSNYIQILAEGSTPECPIIEISIDDNKLETDDINSFLSACRMLLLTAIAEVKDHGSFSTFCSKIVVQGNKISKKLGLSLLPDFNIDPLVVAETLTNLTGINQLTANKMTILDNDSEIIIADLVKIEKELLFEPKSLSKTENEGIFRIEAVYTDGKTSFKLKLNNELINAVILDKDFLLRWSNRDFGVKHGDGLHARFKLERGFQKKANVYYISKILALNEADSMVQQNFKY